MNELIPSFKETILDKGLSDTALDYAELGLDSILDNNIFSDLPFFRTLIGVAKTASNIRERNLLRNTARFINSFNAGTIDADKLDEYQERIMDKKWAELELGRVLVLLDQYVDQEKAILLGIIYRKYVEKQFDWKKFCELSDIINRLFLEDLQFLEHIHNCKKSTAIYHIYEIPYNVKRLEGIGLTEIFGEYTRFGDQLLQSEKMSAQLTQNGELILEALAIARKTSGQC